MAKRYTDSLKWDDPFFLDLPNHYKMLWMFLLDKCDHAGIYKLNPKMAHFCLDYKHDWKDVLIVFKDRIQVLGPGKWFIPKFVRFQYGPLKESNRVHDSIIKILKKEGVNKDCLNSLLEAKDKDKDKDKDKKKKDTDTEFILSIRVNPAYEGLDIDRELAKMDVWLTKHPDRKKSRGFITNWLNKADKPVIIKKPHKPQPEKPFKRPVYSKEQEAERKKNIDEFNKKYGYKIGA